MARKLQKTTTFYMDELSVKSVKHLGLQYILPDHIVIDDEGKIIKSKKEKENE